MDIKKFLRKQNISSRWVTSREPTLSSVVVEQNKLIPSTGSPRPGSTESPRSELGTKAEQVSKGLEVVFIKNNKKLLIGQTLAVQPFKELSFRDYGRPARDDYSGMLPPKLAQIMINLSQAKQSDIILDPFCGSGTILTEAMLMGYKNLIGADMSAKAVSDTNKNIVWMKENYELKIKDYELYNKNVAKLSKFVKPNSVGTIVTEPYLGPQRGRIDIKKVIKELEKLYSMSLVEFRKVLKKDGRVVMIFPVFRKTKNLQIVMPNLNGFKIVNPVPRNLQNNKSIKLTSRKTIIYGREKQRVWREIVILG